MAGAPAQYKHCASRKQGKLLDRILAKKIMNNQANLKSVNNVREVPSSKAGHDSLGRDRHVRQVNPDRHLTTVRNKIKVEHSDDEIENFYEELNNIKSNLKSQDVKIAMGDFNVKVGNERKEDTIGPHGIGDIKAR
ncbi:craniofacial development protein 2-like [Elysia marginata]|uniref:Craniofacial development protein 2-like n=1 Tax=Elysia marginata TaxID=1093978 RepID=A0AAV4HF28_9GAST|nr:craniofacial development protein 2-like [Elysia marginata]